MVAADQTPCPRVNSQLLAQRVGQMVTVVGKVKPGQDGGFVHLEGPDGGDILVDRTAAVRSLSTEYVEIIGTVGADKTIKEERSTDFGNDFDLKQYNEVVLLANGALKHLFQ